MTKCLRDVICSGGEKIDIAILIICQDLDISSLEDAGDPIWDGNVVLDSAGKPLPSPESATGTLESFIAQGISSILSNSPHTSLPMTRLRIQVKGVIGTFQRQAIGKRINLLVPCKIVEECHRKEA